MSSRITGKGLEKHVGEKILLDKSERHYKGNLKIAIMLNGQKPFIPENPVDYPRENRFFAVPIGRDIIEIAEGDHVGISRLYPSGKSTYFHMYEVGKLKP